MKKREKMKPIVHLLYELGGSTRWCCSYDKTESSTDYDKTRFVEIDEYPTVALVLSMDSRLCSRCVDVAKSRLR